MATSPRSEHRYRTCGGHGYDMNRPRDTNTHMGEECESWQLGDG